MEVMIESCDDHPIQTASGEEAHPKRCFGIQGDAQHCLIRVPTGHGFLVYPVDFVEDRIGLRNLFQRATFFTRFSPKPRSLSLVRIVSSVGSSASV